MIKWIPLLNVTKVTQFLISKKLFLSVTSPPLIHDLSDTISSVEFPALGSSLKASHENSNNEVASAKYKSVVLQIMGTNPSNEQRPCVVPPTYGVTDQEISSHVNTLQRLGDNNN